MTQDGFATVNGLRLHYVDFGGGGRPTVAIHGIASTGWSWAEIAAGLGTGARVVAPDLRGHAESQWSPDDRYGSDDAAADIAGLVSELGLGEVDVIGHSWGGLVAVALAARGDVAVRRLVISDIAPSSTAKPDEVAPRQTEFDSWTEALESERKRSPRASEGAIAALTDRTYQPAEGGRFVKRMDPSFLRRWQFRAEDHWDRLAGLSQPTLVVKAAGSQTIPEEVAERMATTLPHGRWVAVADTGHAIHVENPAGFLAVVKPFLEGRG
jgi:pimeloyl-ACP methyl ester carboxylesterase